MKLYDLCIIKNNSDYPDIIGLFAIVLEDCGSYYLMEVWTFKEKEGTRILGVSKEYLRLATKQEKQEYLRKFNEYIEDKNL